MREREQVVDAFPRARAVAAKKGVGEVEECEDDVQDRDGEGDMVRTSGGVVGEDWIHYSFVNVRSGGVEVGERRV